MSIGGIMRTSISGMNAQATRLSAVSENVANSDTTGYKQSETEFSSLILPSNSAGYNSGAVEAQVRNLISEQGGLSYTGNDNNAKKIDLAIDGNGFLAVGDGAGGTYLTRAGSFTQQADGSLVNVAGYTLMGYPVDASGTDSVLNGFAGLQEVNLKTSLLSATPTTEGELTVPLNKDFVVGGTKGTNTQAVPLSGLAAGDTLSFQISVDAGNPITVNVAPGAGGTISSGDLINAINNTAGLSGVASLDGTGRLVLTSNTKKNATESSIRLLQVEQRNSANAVVTPSTVNGLTATPTTSGVPAPLPSANTTLPLENSTRSTSITVYNNSGEAVKLDIYYTKTSDANNTWEVSVFDGRDAAAGTPNAPFPYSTPPIAVASLDFDDNKYTLQSITTGSPATSPATGQTGNKILNINLFNVGGGNFNLDIGNTTQFTGTTQPLAARVNGNPAEVISNIRVGVDGTITASFASGTTRDLFKIPLALVNSPDSMTPKAGNVYSAGIESGTVLMGFGGSAGFGNLTAGALEDSTVDLATELTTMIESQRSYTANSKVFQTGSEILDVLVNLKR